MLDLKIQFFVTLKLKSPS